jgi:6-phosphofructokinase 1
MKVRRIGILTSGGDAPGMNAAIRAVVRTGIEAGWEVLGVASGYRGLVEGRFRDMGRRDAGGILGRSGTVLGSARCPEFKEEETRQTALSNLERAGIDALVVIGGNGSQAGSDALSRAGFPVVGVASTIDNDLYGSATTIGFDSALNVALESIDRLRATASSHHRAIVVEVMGRDTGHLALMAGISGGAEAVAIPEVKMDPEELAKEVRSAYERGKPHAVVVVAEGAEYNAERLVQYFREHGKKLGFKLRATVLGHVQRGGEPTYFDRMLGTRLGAAATGSLASGRHGVLLGVEGCKEVSETPLDQVAGRKKELDTDLLRLASVLAK